MDGHCDPEPAQIDGRITRARWKFCGELELITGSKALADILKTVGGNKQGYF